MVQIDPTIPTETAAIIDGPWAQDHSNEGYYSTFHNGSTPFGGGVWSSHQALRTLSCTKFDLVPTEQKWLIDATNELINTEAHSRIKRLSWQQLSNV